MDPTEVWLPKVSMAMGYTDPPLQGRAWVPAGTLQQNGGRILDIMASLLEPANGINTTPTPTAGREAFHRPLMFNPIVGEGGASTSASPEAGRQPGGGRVLAGGRKCAGRVCVRQRVTHARQPISVPSNLPPHQPSYLIGACMFIDASKVKSTKRHGWTLHDGYLRILLGYHRGQPVIEYGHRLVLYFIFGPPPVSDQGPWECCHMCCHRNCLNPFHLVWGTKKDNHANNMATYISLARKQGHPESTIPSERPKGVF